MTMFTGKDGFDLASPEDLSLVHANALWATANKKKPTTFLGLVQIIPPCYKDNLLCMASIAIKADASDDTSEANIRLYHHLKKSLKKGFRRGIWGINTKFGGEHFYKDMYISDGAISEFRKKYELAPENGDGFVRFEYRIGDPGTA